MAMFKQLFNKIHDTIQLYRAKRKFTKEFGKLNLAATFVTNTYELGKEVDCGRFGKGNMVLSKVETIKRFIPRKAKDRNLEGMTIYCDVMLKNKEV